MVDKKLSEFGSIQPSDVSDIVVLYLDENNSLKNGRLSFNTFVSMLALLSEDNTFTGDNTFSGDVVFSGNATFNNTVNANITGNSATATKATHDGSGNNIETTYATKTELTDKLDLDAENATSRTKETIVGWGMPDYTAGVQVNLVSGNLLDYTATYDGVFIGMFGGGGGNVYLNSIILGNLQVNAGWSTSPSYIVLHKNDRIYTSSSVSGFVGYFFPMKGYNNA